jgi:hypothetical protein
MSRDLLDRYILQLFVRVWIFVCIRTHENKFLQAGPALWGVDQIAVLSKICSVLSCVLEQPRVDNSNAGPNWHKATYILF